MFKRVTMVLYISKFPIRTTDVFYAIQNKSPLTIFPAKPDPLCFETGQIDVASGRATLLSRKINGTANANSTGANARYVICRLKPM